MADVTSSRVQPGAASVKLRPWNVGLGSSHGWHQLSLSSLWNQQTWNLGFYFFMPENLAVSDKADHCDHCGAAALKHTIPGDQPEPA